MIRRIGKKNPGEYLPYFPPGIRTFIDLFMGSGMLTLEMQKYCTNVIANDTDSDISNLYTIITTRKEELINVLLHTPLHDDIWEGWKTSDPEDPLDKAVRFLFLSSCSYLGQGGTLRVPASGDDKKFMIDKIAKTYFQGNVIFLNIDFRDVLPRVSFKKKREQKKTFVYADPPYLDTNNTYHGQWSQQDTEDLFGLLADCGLKFAISEFDHPAILELAHKHHLFVTRVRERQTLKNRRVEMLYTNYRPLVQIPLF